MAMSVRDHSEVAHANPTLERSYQSGGGVVAYEYRPSPPGSNLMPATQQPYEARATADSQYYQQQSPINSPASPRTVAAWSSRPNRVARPPSTIIEQDTHSPEGRSDLTTRSEQSHSVNVPARTSRHHRRQGYLATNEMGSRSSDTPSDGSHDHSDPMSVSSQTTMDNYETPLQLRGQMDEPDKMEPLIEDDPRSFDLVEAAPEGSTAQMFSLEIQSERLFSHDHLKLIFSSPSLFLKFTKFLSNVRPNSVPILVYFLDALKALKAINYANAVAEALDGLPHHPFTATSPQPTINKSLEEKASKAFNIMVEQDLPAYVTYTYIQIVSSSIQRRITGTMASQMQEASEGLAEVFCLTDPSRPDNPIVFASEGNPLAYIGAKKPANLKGKTEFHRTTQYGTNYVIGRNCRFLQGPHTNKYSVDRLRKATTEGKDISECFLNYRRDGSPFMNLLMTAPLCDSRGKVRYFIGAQVDVSGIVKDCVGLESLRRLERQEQGLPMEDDADGSGERDNKDEFQELSEMFNLEELETVRRWGGKMHKENEDNDTESMRAPTRPRLVLKEASRYEPRSSPEDSRLNGRLSGVYQNYLLVRPYPALRILFASPSLRVPGILQSPFMNKIGGSAHVRDEITRAMAEGRGVTARIRWISRNDDEGRHRWIHCTPLTGSTGAVGVWMIVVVDDEKDQRRMARVAPPVDIQARSKSVDRAMSIGNTYSRNESPVPPVPNKSDTRMAKMGKNSMTDLRGTEGYGDSRQGQMPRSPREDQFMPVKRYRDPAARSIRSNRSGSIGHSLDSLQL